MGLISFIKNAGDKLFKSEEKREQEKADLITAHIKKFGFNTSDIQVKVDDDRVKLSGTIDTQENKNKVIVAAGNVEGIAAVDDWLVVRNPPAVAPVSYTHLRAHETPEHLVCRLLLEKKNILKTRT